MKTAFLGLGVMGYPMAGYLSQSHEVTVSVYNRTQIRAEKWREDYHGTVVVNLDELLRILPSLDMVFTCLGGDSDLEEMLITNQVINNMKPGSILIDHTTASAKIARRLREHCQTREVGFLDAPISGGQVGAEKGILSIMVGGDEEVFNRSLPILQSYGKTIELVGGTGAGQTAKMMNQICIAGLLQGLSEALAFGEKSGSIDLEKVLTVISQGAAGSWQMSNRAKTMIKDEYDFGFAVKWMIKDLKIALAEGEKLGANLPIASDVLKRYEELMAKNLGHLDTSSLKKLVD